MYTYTQRRIYHVYILVYILGDVEKQCHQGMKVGVLHSLHVARYTLATRSSTAQVWYIKKEGAAILCILSSLLVSSFSSKCFIK